MVKSADLVIREYLTERGCSPFTDWLLDLNDMRARARIRTRLDRLSLGNWGDFAFVGDGIRELRLFEGPGYRVYCGIDRDGGVVLLCAGTKASQPRDVKRAKALWVDFRRRKNAGR